MKKSMQGTENSLHGRKHVTFMASDHPITGSPDHPILEVVQNHRRLRTIAPTIASAPTCALAGVPQLTWTAATQAVFAAWLPLSFTRIVVVASAGKSGTRVSQTARTSLGRNSRLILNYRPFVGCNKSYRVLLVELAGTGRHIISYRLAPRERAPASDTTMA